MKKVVRLTEYDLVRIVKRVIKEDSTESITELMIDIENKIIEIRTLIGKTKSKLKYKIKNFFKKKLKPNEEIPGMTYQQLAFFDEDPTVFLTHQYENILMKYTNGKLNFDVEDINYGDIDLMRDELIVFKRRLDGLEVLIKHEIITDYPNISI